ncbi:MAG: penicillin-binding transpeptidase domain-containing protein [Planctomycetota bacterium]
MFQRRVWLIGIAFGIAFAVLLGRLFSLQIVQGSSLRKRGENRLDRREQIPPRRGGIFDRNGRILAEDAPSCDLWIRLGRWTDSGGARREELILGEVTAGSVRAILAASGAQEIQERDLALEYLERELPLTADLAAITDRPKSAVARALLEAALQAVKDEAPGALQTPRKLLEDMGRRAYLSILRDQNIFGADSRFDPLELRLGWRRIYPYGEAAAHITGYVAPLTAEEYARLRGAWRPEGMVEGAGEIPGFFVPTEVERERMRLYEVTSKGQTLRAAGFLACDLVGRLGAEEEYNNELRGSHGLQLLRLSRASPKAPRRMEVAAVEAEGEPGRDIALTLDAELQKKAYEILTEATERLRSEENRPYNAACILMRPKTGAIEALVSLPTFHPSEVGRRYTEYVHPRSRKPFLNRVISEIYPPGSTFKPVVALAALKNGAITPATEFDCQGEITQGNYRYICMRHFAHGPINVHDALRLSCNVFFYNTGRALGAKALYDFATDIGFGACRGIDLPNEKPGILPEGARTGRGWTLGNTFHMAMARRSRLRPCRWPWPWPPLPTAARSSAPT